MPPKEIGNWRMEVRAGDRDATCSGSHFSLLSSRFPAPTSHFFSGRDAAKGNWKLEVRS